MQLFLSVSKLSTTDRYDNIYHISKRTHSNLLGVVGRTPSRFVYELREFSSNRKQLTLDMGWIIKTATVCNRPSNESFRVPVMLEKGLFSACRIPILGVGSVPLGAKWSSSGTVKTCLRLMLWRWNRRRLRKTAVTAISLPKEYAERVACAL